MSVGRVHVIGLGRSGYAVAMELLKENRQVIISDDADEQKIGSSAEELRQMGAVVCLSGHHAALEAPVELVVLSPGVPTDHPAVISRRSQSVEIIGELEFGWRRCRGTVAAITGSNGKSTATALLGNIFSASRRPSFTCGNIGVPLTAISGQTTPDSMIAVEVSSYQLETIRSFKPDVAVILNITPDHLERHKTLANYANTKARICLNFDQKSTLIYNLDDPVVCQLVNSSIPSYRLIPFSTTRMLDLGGWIDGARLCFRVDSSEPIEIDRNSIHLPGLHNVANTLAAVLSGLVCGIDFENIKTIITSFRGLPHRLEVIRKRNGVTWINDSKATNVDSGRIALEAISSPIILIAGGRGKGGGYKQIRDLVAQKVSHLILLGEAANEIEADLGDICPVDRVNSIEGAVLTASNIAQKGVSVLLSPLCASFDMFRNFEERGDIYRSLVEKLP